MALAAVLVAGALLRLLFVASWRPAFMGWPDSASYIDVSQGQLFGNELRPAGYPMFLRLLHGIAPSLVLVMVVQHLLGLAAAGLLYMAVRRAGGPCLMGVLPAAIVALGGDEVFLEHAPISEALFIFLVAAALYAGVRALEASGLRWPGACGLCLATAATVRVVAVPLLLLFAVWVIATGGTTLRRRLAMAAVGAGAALSVIGGYYLAEYRAVGKTGLSRNGIWNVYGRVAPFADCSKFKPPAGTEPLCESTPRPERPLTSQYTFNWYYSPAIRVFDNPHTATAAEDQEVAAFAWAVILHQPLDYAGEVGAGLLRYVAPDSFEGVGGGPSYHDLVHQPILFNRLYREEGRKVARKHYGDVRRFAVDRGLLGGLLAYESVTRIQGPLFVLLAALSIAAPLLTRGRTRSAALLFSLTAWTLMVVPVATVEFSARTAVPGFGPLGAAAAIGGWRVLAALRRRPRTKRGLATAT